jgi:hypothetical protein
MNRRDDAGTAETTAALRTAETFKTTEFRRPKFKTTKFKPWGPTWKT